MTTIQQRRAGRGGWREDPAALGQKLGQRPGQGRDQGDAQDDGHGEDRDDPEEPERGRAKPGARIGARARRVEGGKHRQVTPVLEDDDHGDGNERHDGEHAGIEKWGNLVHRGLQKRLSALTDRILRFVVARTTPRFPRPSFASSHPRARRLPEPVVSCRSIGSSSFSCARWRGGQR